MLEQNRDYAAQTALGQQRVPGAPPLTLTSALDLLDQRIVQALNVLSNANRVAVSLLGVQLRAVESASEEVPQPTSIIERIKLREQRLGSILSGIDGEISRIGNAI